MRSFPARPPTCSPSSSLTFNPSPPGNRISPHPFHCVRLLVIIIAAVNHLHCQTLLGSTISVQALPGNSESPENHLFLSHMSPVSSCSPFSPQPHSSHWALSPLLPLSHLVWAARCVCASVCVRGVGDFSGKQGLLCVYALM